MMSSKHCNGRTKYQSASTSPLDSFLDFYESIPDYQDITHLSDKEFADKMKILRDRQRQYLHHFNSTYSPMEYEERSEDFQSSRNKSKLINKLDLEKEWVHKSCSSLSSLGKKSGNSMKVQNVNKNNKLRSRSPVKNQRNYLKYEKKLEVGHTLVDSGSIFSADINGKVDGCNDENESKPNLLRSEEGDFSCISPGRSESFQGIPYSYGYKDHARTYKYDLYNENSNEIERQSSPLNRNNILSPCGVQSIETSDVNPQDGNMSLNLSHQENMANEDYYVPTSGWMHSDSDSMLGIMYPTPSTRPSTTAVSQSIPESPVSKRTSCSPKTNLSKKKVRKKKKAVTKPVPFSFMCNDRQYSRSTPDLRGQSQPGSLKYLRSCTLPGNSFSNYIYQKKQDDDFFRALRRKVGLERAASLPPSQRLGSDLGSGPEMQTEASLLAGSSSSERSGAAAKGGGGAGGAGRGSGTQPNTSSGRGRCRRARRPPRPPRPPPDFPKCHEKMRQELSERQSRNVTTSPSPYSLRTASLSPRRRCLQGSASSGSAAPRTSLQLNTSRSNLAALLRIQTARQRLEAEHRRVREAQVRRAELRLRERLRRLTPAWRAIQYSTEEDLALRAAARREEERQRHREYGVLMRHMLHRVHTIPTLFERQSAPLSRGSNSATSPRRSTSHSFCLEECGPECPALPDLQEDKNVADLKLFEDTMPPRTNCPFRSRRRERPCSADSRLSSSRVGSTLRASRSASPRKQVPPGGPLSPTRALQSPDRLSNKLRHYHRHLLQPTQPAETAEPHQHRVGFSDSRPLGDTDQKGGGGETRVA